MARPSGGDGPPGSERGEGIGRGFAGRSRGRAAPRGVARGGDVRPGMHAWMSDWADAVAAGDGAAAAPPPPPPPPMVAPPPADAAAAAPPPPDAAAAVPRPQLPPPPGAVPAPVRGRGRSRPWRNPLARRGMAAGRGWIYDEREYVRACAEAARTHLQLAEAEPLQAHVRLMSLRPSARARGVVDGPVRGRGRGSALLRALPPVEAVAAEAVADGAAAPAFELVTAAGVPVLQRVDPVAAWHEPPEQARTVEAAAQYLTEQKLEVRAPAFAHPPNVPLTQTAWELLLSGDVTIGTAAAAPVTGPAGDAAAPADAAAAAAAAPNAKSVSAGGPEVVYASDSARRRAHQPAVALLVALCCDDGGAGLEHALYHAMHPEESGQSLAHEVTRANFRAARGTAPDPAPLTAVDVAGVIVRGLCRNGWPQPLGARIGSSAPLSFATPDMRLTLERLRAQLDVQPGTGAAAAELLALRNDTGFAPLPAALDTKEHASAWVHALLDIPTAAMVAADANVMRDSGYGARAVPLNTHAFAPASGYPSATGTPNRARVAVLHDAPLYRAVVRGDLSADAFTRMAVRILSEPALTAAAPGAGALPFAPRTVAALALHYVLRAALQGAAGTGWSLAVAWRLSQAAALIEHAFDGHAMPPPGQPATPAFERAVAAAACHVAAAGVDVEFVVHAKAVSAESANAFETMPCAHLLSRAITARRVFLKKRVKAGLPSTVGVDGAAVTDAVIGAADRADTRPGIGWARAHLSPAAALALAETRRRYGSVDESTPTASAANDDLTALEALHVVERVLSLQLNRLHAHREGVLPALMCAGVLGGVTDLLALVRQYVCV